MKPTQEQAIALKGVKLNKKVKVVAAAGSGKTTFLEMCANDNPEYSLYLTFNKNMAEEARGRFPDNVDVRTTHSIAFAYTGREIAHKLVRPRGAYKNVCGTGSEIARHYRIAPYVLQGGRSISGTAMGYAVRSTLARFEQSASKEIGTIHVSFSEAEKELKNPYFSKTEYAARVLKYAKRLWEERIDPESDILATHDTYLKLFQLKGIELDGYERIYLDESHDSNPCLLDIVLSQDVPIVMVGDQYQAIYQWRGAIDALGMVDWPTFYLTKSFRFGEDIASAARSVLTDSEGNILLPVKGNENKNSKIVDEMEEFRYTKVFRTNAALIAEGIDMIAQGMSIALNIDVRDFRNLIDSVSHLKDGDMKGVKHQDVIAFNSWTELSQEMEVSSNAELKRVHKYVSEGVHWEMLRVLDSYIPPVNPDIIFTTAHRSKGLEYDHVVLAEDFKNPEYSDNGDFIGWSDAERNLLYVALTRAKESLKLNSMIKEVHEDFDDVFDIPFGSNTLREPTQEDLNGIELRIKKMYVLGGGDKRGAEMIGRDLSHTEHAIAAQDQMDMLDGNDDFESSHNIDGSLRLMPVDLESEVRRQCVAMGWNSGEEINQLSEWVVDSTPEDDDDNWKNIGMRG